MNDFADSDVIGAYRGMNILFSNRNAFAPKIVLKGQLAYTTDYSYTTAGSVTKIINLAKAPEQRKKNLEQILGDLYKQLEASKQQLKQKFEYENELSEMLEKQSRLNNLLEFGSSEQEQEEIIDEATL